MYYSKMKYEVLWHDCEDDRSGTPFKIEGSNPREAYFKAEEHIKSLSPYLRAHYFCLDIECLIDEQGEYHNPDIFLRKEQNGNKK